MSAKAVAAPRILIVDDHPLVRTSLRAVLEHAGMEVAGEAGNVAEALEAAARAQPDVILLDVRLPDGSGAEACSALRAARARSRIVLLSAYEDEAAMYATLFSAADAYVLKDISGADLVRAIHMVLNGLSVVTPRARMPVLRRFKAIAGTDPRDTRIERLSERERHTLALVAQGKTNREIALAMGISLKAVKTSISQIFRKLGVSRRAEAVARLPRDAP